MKTSTILSEAWRNIRTGTTRALLLAFLLAICATVLAATDVTSIVRLEQEATQFRDSGASIRTVSAEASIDPASCDAVASAPTVTASGALGAATAISVTTLPGSSIPAYAVTPSFAAVLGLDTSLERGVWIPEGLAETLQATVGTVLQTTTGEMRISGIYDWPDDGRDSRLNYAFLIPDATKTSYDECWASIWPTSTESEDLLRFAGATDRSDDTPLTLSQVNKKHGTSFDGNTEYQSRITQYTLPIGLAIGLLIAFTSVRLRRLEYAGALHAGQRRTTTIATALLETLVWAGTAAVLAAAATLLIARVLSPESGFDIAATSIRTVLATAAGTFVGTVISLVLIRESHLFRYFKDR